MSVANPTTQIPSTNDALICSPAAIATVVLSDPAGAAHDGQEAMRGPPRHYRFDDLVTADYAR